MQPLADRLWSKVKHGPDCWEWQGAIHTEGYGILGRGRRGEGLIRAHRASWTVTYGPIPSGLWVLHKCDNRLCVRPDHLFVGTARDNSQDAVRKGRASPPPRPASQKGDKNYAAKLTAAQVGEICSLLHRGQLTQTALAKAFDISRRTIGLIKAGKHWTQIQMEEAA